MASFLYTIRCDNCGSEYRINSRGEMNCPFCGSKIYLNDKDFEEFLKTRDEMLNKDRFTNDFVNTDGDILSIWYDSSLEILNGVKDEVICRYTFKFEDDDEDIYVSGNKVTVISNKSYITGDSLDYPSADIKNLKKYLPSLMDHNILEDGINVNVFAKDENVYPLALFSNLDAKTVAWITSRFENLACLFEFNGIDFHISIYDCFINPKTHELYLIGNFIRNYDFNHQFLRDSRDIAKSILNESTAPQMYLDFLDGTPAVDAYTDFKRWDDVIEYGFNGHNFHKFDGGN